MAYDLGDVVTVSVNVKDSAGAAANAGAMVLTITAPDGTTSTPSPTNTPTGVYTATYTPDQVGRHLVRWVATGANAGAYTDVFDVLDPALMPLVSLADVKAHLNIATTADDEELRRTLAVATEMAERHCNRALRRKTVVESYDGDTCALLLRQAPVLSVTTVVENGTTLTATDYTLDAAAGILYRGSATASFEWIDGRQVVTVTYVAGYTDPPQSAQQAVLELARHLWQTQRGNVALPTLGGVDDYAYAANSGQAWSLPNRVRELLAPLVMPGIA